ncbi:MAG: hypothetical protein NC914_00675 [Candidatus Omnitrophica bacterium]|nr:hypothetical protein [Candidatus Omnitrophota bacterium]
MKKIFLTAGLVILILGLGLAIFSYVQAQSEGAVYGARPAQAFSYLQAFFSDEKIGFFDTREGKIYIYNTATNNCEKILQLRSAGNPLMQIR